jgi:hypothetical protein
MIKKELPFFPKNVSYFKVALSGKVEEIFDCCKQSLKRLLLYPPTHPGT